MQNLPRHSRPPAASDQLNYRQFWIGKLAVLFVVLTPVYWVVPQTQYALGILTGFAIASDYWCKDWPGLAWLELPTIFVAVGRLIGVLCAVAYWVGKMMCWYLAGALLVTLWWLYLNGYHL